MLIALGGITAVVFSTTALLLIRHCLNIWRGYNLETCMANKLTGRQTDEQTVPLLPCVCQSGALRRPAAGRQSHPPALFSIYTIVSHVFQPIHHCGVHAGSINTADIHGLPQVPHC